MRIFTKKARAGSTRSDRAIEKVEEKRYVSENLNLNIEIQKQKYIDDSKKMIARQLENLKGLPERPKAMEPFYETASFFNKRISELYNFKKAGGKVIGTMCVSVPNELILAAGAIPLRVCSGFYEPVFSANELLGDVGLCPLVRSILGNKMVGSNPYLELCDLLVVPTTCDGKMKLGEILSDYLPVLMLSVPRIKEGNIAHQQWVEEIKFFGRKLEELTGQKITVKGLKQVIEKYQRAQQAYFHLMELRAGTEKPPLWGRDALLVTQMTMYEDIDRWTTNLEALNQELGGMVTAGKSVGKPDDPRLLLMGSPVVWPNWKILNIVEESNAVIVADELCSSERLYYDPVVVDEYVLNDMYRALAERYLYPCTCPCFTPNNERCELLMNKIRKYKIDGVIFHMLKGCHLNSIESIRIEKMLHDNKIGMWKIESEYDEGDVEQIRTRVEAFLEIIRMLKEVEAEGGLNID